MGVWCHAALFPAPEKKKKKRKKEKAAGPGEGDGLDDVRKWCLISLLRSVWVWTLSGSQSMPVLDVGAVQVCRSAACCTWIIELWFLVCFGGGEINLLFPPHRLLLLWFCFFFFLRDLLKYLEGLSIYIYSERMPVLLLLQFSQLTIRFLRQSAASVLITLKLIKI